MRTLLRYELKKLFSRKVLWFALALCAAVQMLYCYGDIRLALGGAVGGMKEVYARYDGQILTESLKAHMLSDYKEYAAAHPEEFKPSEYDNSGYWAQDNQIWQRRHGYGVMLAYQNLSYMQTWDENEKAWQTASDELASGEDANGNPLSPDMRRRDERLTACPPYVPVVRYDLGWSFGSGSQDLADILMSQIGIWIDGYTPLGMLLLLLLLLAGLPGFPGERAARMEPVWLTCARRRPAAHMKLLAVISVVAAAALALNLLQLLLRAAAYGLGGWQIPVSPYSMSYLAAWAIATLSLTLGCASGAAVITALSSLVRNNLAALGLAAGALGAQFGLWALVQIIFNGQDSGWAVTLNNAMSALPLNTIVTQGVPFGILPTAAQAATLFALPLSLCTVCLLGAPAYWLRRRKA